MYLCPSIARPLGPAHSRRRQQNPNRAGRIAKPLLRISQTVSTLLNDMGRNSKIWTKMIRVDSTDLRQPGVLPHRSWRHGDFSPDFRAPTSWTLQGLYHRESSAACLPTRHRESVTVRTSSRDPGPICRAVSPASGMLLKQVAGTLPGKNHRSHPGDALALLHHHRHCHSYSPRGYCCRCNSHRCRHTGWSRSIRIRWRSRLCHSYQIAYSQSRPNQIGYVYWTLCGMQGDGKLVLS